VAPASIRELVWTVTELSQDQVARELDLVTLAPQTSGSPINFTCIGNSATLTGAALAPGEVVSLFGVGFGPPTPATAQVGTDQRFPTSLSNTQVTFNGIAAPLIYVSSNQINAVAPFGLSPDSTAQACVIFDGKATNCMTVLVRAAAPGIFLNPATPNLAAAINQDGTVNSQQDAAPGGSVVSLFVTGLGPITPAPEDGSLVQFPLPTQNLKVQVQIPNPDFHNPLPYFAEVLYTGPAPFEINGMSQINIRVPTYFPVLTCTVLVTLPDGTSVASNSAYVFVNLK
jgi:uncharacterized protein (TIGR03437 family)